MGLCGLLQHSDPRPQQQGVALGPPAQAACIAQARRNFSALGFDDCPPLAVLVSQPATMFRLWSGRLPNSPNKQVFTKRQTQKLNSFWLAGQIKNPINQSLMAKARQEIDMPAAQRPLDGRQRALEWAGGGIPEPSTSRTSSA